jgi:hypothetical protein
MSISRRSFLNTSPLIFTHAFLNAAGARPSAAARSPESDAPDPAFPTQPPELVREMVAVSHGNLARVKELLASRPTLARAAFDWGFGDWEDALGAASHVGNREIAETLLAHGARPTIFSAAMLGQLETVKAFIAASPGIEATPGPHSITLLRHAMAGGARAQAVTDYLKTLPDADKRPDSQPLTAEEMAALAGEYGYGTTADERITISVSNNALVFTRIGRSGRGLTHVGDRAFFPVGAPRVRIRFRESPTGMLLTVHDPDVVLEARRSSTVLQ